MRQLICAQVLYLRVEESLRLPCYRPSLHQLQCALSCFFYNFLQFYNSIEMCPDCFFIIVRNEFPSILCSVLDLLDGRGVQYAFLLYK